MNLGRALCDPSATERDRAARMGGCRTKVRSLENLQSRIARLTAKVL
jgi:hypothetical protein